MIEALRAFVLSPLTVATVLTLVGLAAVLIAWYRETPEKPAPAVDLGLLPAPSDLRRIDFPMRVAGYDPSRVEMHIEMLARAYSDLYEAAPADVRAEARRRAAHRMGLDVVDVDITPAPSPLRSAVAGPDADALRTEAALADLESPSPSRPRWDKRSPAGP